MKKELKDYLHLYLGCEVQYEGITNGSELKKEIKENEGNIFYEPKVEVKRGLKTGVLKEIITNISNTSIKSRIGRKGLQTHYGNGNFKLILRPLSDMTEEEELEIEGEFGSYGLGGNHLCNALKAHDFRYVKKLDDAFELTKYLLSKHFDIFGLKEAGLAIYKTTM